MTGDQSDNRPRGDRPRRGSRREPAVIDLTAETVAGSPGSADPREPEPTPVPADAMRAMRPGAESPGVASADEPAAAASDAGETRLGDADPLTTPVPGAEIAPELVTPPESDVSPATMASSPEPVDPAGATPSIGEGDGPRGETSAAEQAAAELGLTQPVPDLGESSESRSGSPFDAEATTPRSSVPPTSPTLPPAARRPSVAAPLMFGVLGGFLGAALLAGGFYFFGPAGDIGERLTGLEAGLGERASRRTVETLEKRVAGLDSGTQTLRTDQDGLARRVDALPKDLPALFGRMDRVERNVADIAAQPRPQGSAAAAAPAPQPPPVVAARESAVLSIALLLRDALGRGTPYQRELEALQGAGVNAAQIDALKPFAASGAPSPAALAGTFAPIGERLANPPPPPANTVTDRISTSLTTLFKVRPVGEARGDAPAALAARAEAALKRGALPDAAAALDRLPPADAGPAESFRATLKARIAADKAADAILSNAVDELLAAAKLPGGSAP